MGVAFTISRGTIVREILSSSPSAHWTFNSHSMPVDPEQLEPFVNRTGPVNVVHEDGSAVSYGASARLDMLDPNRKDTWAVEHVQLTLLDEQARLVRAIPGAHILSVNEESVGYTVMVDASEQKDPGDTLTTRGA